VNGIVPIPAPQIFATYDTLDHALHTEPGLAAALTAAGAGTIDIWLVTAGWHPELGIDFHSKILEHYLRRCYQTVSDRAFFKSRIRFLHRLRNCSPVP
jgi:hypothetical protein